MSQGTNHRRISDLALFVDTQRKAAVDAAKAVAAIAGKNGVPLQVRPEQSAALGLNGARASSQFPSSADLVVSLGGDGTLLQAAHLAAPLCIPIVGVDFGRMGFLTELPRKDFETTLERLLLEGIETEARTALEASVDGENGKLFALNDIHIDRKDHGHIVTFGIRIGGEHVADIPADGIVVSSPTGSTAYFLSAGGPILSPRLDAIGIAPICPHTLFSRPLVVSAEESIVITVPNGDGGATLFADGRLATDLAPGSRVRINKAAQRVEFVKFDNRHFFQVLERKLHWGMSIKRSLSGDPKV